MRIYRIVKKEKNKVGQFVKGWELTAFSIAEFGIYTGGTRVWKLGGEDYIKVKFSVEEPVYLRVGDFTQYDGQMFILTQPYSPTYNETTGGYDYDVQFEAYYKVLMNRTFMLSYRSEHSDFPERFESNWKYTGNLESFVEILENNCFADEMIYPVGEPEEILSGDAAPHTFKFQAYPLRFGFYGNVDTRSLHNINSEGSGHENDFATPKELESGKVEYVCDNHKYLTFEGVSMNDAIQTLCSEENFNCESWFEADNNMVVFGRIGGKIDYEKAEEIRGVVISTPRGDRGFDKEAESLSVSSSEKENYNRLRLWGSKQNIPSTYGKKIILQWLGGNSWVLGDMSGNPVRTFVTMFTGEREDDIRDFRAVNAVGVNLPGVVCQEDDRGVFGDWVYGESVKVSLTPKSNGGLYILRFKLSFSPQRSYEGEPSCMLYVEYRLKSDDKWSAWKSITKEGYRMGFGEFDMNYTSTPIELTTDEVTEVELRIRAAYYGNGEYYSVDQLGSFIRVSSLYMRRVDYSTIEAPLVGYDKDLFKNGEEAVLRITGFADSAKKYEDVTFQVDREMEVGSYWEITNPALDKDWQEYLYTYVGDKAKYASSVEEARLPMLDENGAVVDYVDADNMTSNFADGIIEKVEYDETFYPKLTMKTDKTAGREGDKTAITLYEFNHNAPRPDDDQKTDAWSVSTEYNDGSKNIQYYEYYLLNDTITDILTKQYGNEYGITQDWLMQGETLKVHFNTGKLAGMEFEAQIESYKDTEEKKEKHLGKLLSVIPNEDYGQVLPNKELHPEVGDEYVIVGWNPIYLDSGTSIIKSAGYRLYKEAKERVNDAQREHNTYTIKMMADSATEQVRARLYDKYGEEVNDKSGNAIYTTDKDYIPQILPQGAYVRISDKGCFKEERIGIRNCSELLRIVGIEHPLDIPYDSLIYTIGETPVLKGKLNSLSKAIKRI